MRGMCEFVDICVSLFKGKQGEVLHCTSRLKLAWRVFRCSTRHSTHMHTRAHTRAHTHTSRRGKVLALELLKLLLENTGPVFQSSDLFTTAIRQHLCASLLRNRCVCVCCVFVSVFRVACVCLCACVCVYACICFILGLFCIHGFLLSGYCAFLAGLVGWSVYVGSL